MVHNTTEPSGHLHQNLNFLFLESTFLGSTFFVKEFSYKYFLINVNI